MARDDDSAKAIETALSAFEGRILAFDEPASLTYAALRSHARSAGQAIGNFDALIAGIALSHGFGVATRDNSPFRAVGVEPVIDPFS